MTGPAGDPDLMAAESAAELRRAQQREQIVASRRARVLRAAPWIGAAVLAVAAAVCIALAVRPAAVPLATGTATGGGLALRVERVLPTIDATPGAPTGLAVSGDRVYVADPQRGALRVLTREGSLLATIGAGWLMAPVYVAVGPVDGRVYVSDRGRGTVAVFTSEGKRFGVLTPSGLRPGAASGPAWRPLALAFGPDGTLYVADSGQRQAILVFSPAGSRVGTIGADVPVGRSGSRLAFVNGLAATGDRIVAADSNNGRLLVFDGRGHFQTEIAMDGLPRGVALTASNRFVVTNAASDAVALLDSAGVTVQALTGGVGDREQFAAPSRIALDDAGSIYVADAGTGRVSVPRTGEGGAARVAIPASTRLWLLVIGAIAAAVAIGLSIFIARRARARVREAGVTL